MKKIYLFFIVAFFSLAIGKLNAQEFANYNLYMQNGYLYNPAHTFDNMFSAYLNSHIQWVGFDGAPRVNTFGIHGPFSKNMGLGLNIVNKKHGIMNNFAGQLSYGYRAKFADDNYLTLGVGAGFINDKLNSADVTGITDLTDPALVNNVYDNTSVLVSAGLSYYFKGLEAQLVFPQLYERKILNTYMLGILSYDLMLSGGTWKLKPSVLVRGTKTTPYQFEGNLMGEWNNTIWLQAGYRSSNALIYSAGVSFNGFKLGYAYQMDNDVLGLASSGTHEIQLIYKFGDGLLDRKPTTTNLSGTVKNQLDGGPVIADVIFYDETGVEVLRTTSNDKGNYKADLPIGKTYKVEVNAPNFYSVNDIVAIGEEETNKTYDAILKPKTTSFIGITEPGNATVKLYDEKGTIVYTGKSDNDGNYQTALEPCKTYKLEVSVDGYVTKSETFTMPCDKMEFEKETDLEQYLILKGSVKNKATGELMPAKLTITNAAGEVTTSTVTGTVEEQLVEGKYTIQVSGKGFVTLKETVNLTKATAKDFFLDVRVTPLAADQSFELGQVNFETNKAIIKDSASYAVLDELVTVMTDNPELSVTISGHTDNVGDDAKNLKLSQDRADACKAYAVSKGISANRLIATGYGETIPLVPNDTAANKAKNRRVEFKIVE